MRIHGTGILAALLAWFPGAVMGSCADTPVRTFTLTGHFSGSHAGQGVVCEPQKEGVTAVFLLHSCPAVETHVEDAG